MTLRLGALLASIDSRLHLLTWMVTVQLGLTLGLFWLIFKGGVR